MGSKDKRGTVRAQGRYGPLIVGVEVVLSSCFPFPPALRRDVPGKAVPAPRAGSAGSVRSTKHLYVSLTGS